MLRHIGILRAVIARLLAVSAAILVCLAVLNTTEATTALAQGAGTEFSDNNEFRLLYFKQKSGRIAFTYSRGTNEDIYVLDFGTLTVYPFVTGPSDDQQPRWSPDGRWLAFASDRSGQSQIYLAGEDDTEPVQVTNLEGDSYSPDWSPDGAYIVFHSTHGGSGKSLYVMGADGSYPRAITKTNRANTVARWSPRGTELIYSTNEFWPGWDLVLYDFNSAKSKLLTKGISGFCRASWHPSGSIVVLSYGTGTEIDLWAFQKGMDRILPLVQRPGREYDAEWMDEGNKLIFSGEVVPGSGRYELFIWEKSSKKVHQLTESRGSIRHPSWTALPSLNSIRQKAEFQLRSKS